TFTGGAPESFTGQEPVAVTYDTPGDYTVELTVSDGSNSDTETKTAYISVQALNADFTASQTTIPVGGSINYTNFSSCADTYLWTFDGGFPASSTSADPGTITYNTAGDYNVSLEVFKGGNSHLKTIIIHVIDIQYCNSSGGAGYEWISGIDIAGQLNSSGSAGVIGYQDFTGFVFNLDPGSANTITLTPAFAGRSRFQYWSIWIDYNNNGDFDDAGELALQIPKKKSAVISTLNIPSDASGTTRMRITMKYNAYATSCETGFSGEVEDYTISFEPPIPQAPEAEFSADNTLVTIGGTVNFTDESLYDPTSWSWVFEGGTPATSTAQNPSVTYATEGIYDVRLTATNAEGSDQLIKYDYIEVSSSVQYCVTTANNTSDYIESIIIDGVTHNSGQGSTSGYDYYTTPSFTFIPGSTVNVSLTPHVATNRNFWRIWIDFNNDGDFTDADETVLVANNKKGTYTKSISIPTDVEAVSPDRMRITMKTGGSPSSCETGFNGEVEDYDVLYAAGGDVFKPSDDQFKLSIYPNPADDILNIIVSGNQENVKVNIYNVIGNLIQSFNMGTRHEQISITDLHEGLYFIHVQDGDEIKLKKFIKR
ncbi:MAG: GEVED domain-containing protein, partial [Bacteroidota bacterium]